MASPISYHAHTQKLRSPLIELKFSMYRVKSCSKKSADERGAAKLAKLAGKIYGHRLDTHFTKNTDILGRLYWQEGE